MYLKKYTFLINFLLYIITTNSASAKIFKKNTLNTTNNFHMYVNESYTFKFKHVWFDRLVAETI